MDISANVIIGYQLLSEDRVGTLVGKKKEKMVLVTYCK